jgi:hypothetical protein
MWFTAGNHEDFDLLKQRDTGEITFDDVTEGKPVKGTYDLTLPDGKRLRGPGLPALPRRRGRLQRQGNRDGPALPPHAFVVAGRRVGALRGRRALRLSSARRQGRRHGPQEAGQPTGGGLRYRRSIWTTTRFPTSGSEAELHPQVNSLSPKASTLK